MNSRVIALAAVLGSGMLAAQALAQTSTTAAGPYYATPSWDQKLPSATRFIVLSNWGNQAVLDRETGLVWERSADRPATFWYGAFYQCIQSTVGGRSGWRLPTVHELLRTVVAGSNFETVTDSPFAHLATGKTYWTSTRGQPSDPNDYFAVPVGSARTGLEDAGSSNNYVPWCVQSPSSARGALD